MVGLMFIGIGSLSFELGKKVGSFESRQAVGSLLRPTGPACMDESGNWDDCNSTDTFGYHFVYIGHPETLTFEGVKPLLSEIQRKCVVKK